MPHWKNILATLCFPNRNNERDVCICKIPGVNQTKNVLRARVIGNCCDFTHVFRADDEWNFTWMFNLLFIQLGWLHRY